MPKPKDLLLLLLLLLQTMVHGEPIGSSLSAGLRPHPHATWPGLQPTDRQLPFGFFFVRLV